MAAPFEHHPVLLAEVREAARPVLAGRPAAVLVDGTVGGAGHASALLAEAGPDATLVGLDRDPTAVAAARARLAPFGARALVLQGSYAALDELAPSVIGAVDLILVDLGVSSPQLDTAARGFGFRQDGPLDMRFDPTAGAGAAEVLDRLDADALADTLREHGDVPQARRVARALLGARSEGRLDTTQALARVVEGVLGRPRSGRIHAATLVFQALRIAVNDELEHLRRFLLAVPRWLRPGGRLLAIAFHSGEDRLVKHSVRYWERGPSLPPGFPAPPWPPVLRALTKRPIEARPEEAERNPRARSARLRVAERTDAPVPQDASPWSAEKSAASRSAGAGGRTARRGR